jgi:peptide/nickel transport system permease protein
LGATAGFYGGRYDNMVIWLYSTFASMPTLLFILAFALLFSRNFLPPEAMRLTENIGAIMHADSGALAVYLAIGITGWVTLCRVVRAESMRLRTMPFVDAARVAGVRDSVIILRHIIPNVFHLVIIYFTLSFAGAILLEVIVSYLGFGVQNAPSWGVMIADGQERLWRGIWWEIVGATGFMFVLVLALNLLGDALRDALDPKQRV